MQNERSNDASKKEHSKKEHLDYFLQGKTNHICSFYFYIETMEYFRQGNSQFVDEDYEEAVEVKY